MTQVLRRLPLLWGKGFKFRADQISHTLPTTCHNCNLEVRALA